MKYENQKEKPIKIAKGKYTYRGYTIENLGPKPGYYGGTAFRPNRWQLHGTGFTQKNLNYMCEVIDEWLDDPFHRDENGENTSMLKLAIRENNA